MAYNPRDYYFHKAKAENFAARSVFKIEEIDQKFHLFKPGMQVLDLGAAPGSWTQFAAKKVGAKGRVLGIDLQPIKLTLPNAAFVAADLRARELPQIMEQNGFKPPFDVVLSDMAPKTSGIRLQDQARSLELCEIALEAAENYLRVGGHFVCKLFHSDEFEDFRAKLRLKFDKVEVLRPKSTRKESKEIFFVAKGYRKPKAAPVAGNADAPQEGSR
jgi:23S rRNA (uridine2552-2'-O)-methyltransferase